MMKKNKVSLIIGSFIFSTLTWACPDLNGRFRCPDPRGGTMTVLIEQQGQEFHIKGLEPLEHLIANGEWQEVDDSAMYKNARYKGSCLGEAVLSSIRGDLYQNNFYSGKAVIEMKLEKMPSGHLKRKVKGTIQGPFIQIPVSDESTCLKI